MTTSSPNEVEVPIKVEKGPTSPAQAIGQVVLLGAMILVLAASLGAGAAVAVATYHHVLRWIL